MSGKLPLAYDWFISAVIKDGSVGDCLAEVVGELRRKERFVQRLSEKISEQDGSHSDALSRICTRVRILDSTLKFRVSVLNPDRRGAWFRTSAATASGPFVSAILPDAVFSQYDESKTKKIRAGLNECWQQRNLVSYPLKATESCLWKILLTLNYELERLGDLGEWPRIETLPEALPVDFESRSLRAFLSNVKAEYMTAREYLKHSHMILLEASERFWAGAPRPKIPAGRDDAYEGQTEAENLRQGFRDRRATPTIKRPMGKSLMDVESLKFMGFEDFPTSEHLKQRYHSLAMDMHPDRLGGNEARFKQLAKCYKHLVRFC
jgi:hypothetical protein